MHALMTPDVLLSSGVMNRNAGYITRRLFTAVSIMASRSLKYSDSVILFLHQVSYGYVTISDVISHNYFVLSVIVSLQVRLRLGVKHPHNVYDKQCSICQKSSGGRAPKVRASIFTISK